MNESGNYLGHGNGLACCLVMLSVAAGGMTAFYVVVDIALYIAGLPQI